MDLHVTHSRAALSKQIKEAGQSLGFDLVGISPVKLPADGESFARWLRGGLAGELGYMERTEALRRNPHELVPWAVSVVSVGINYYTSFPRLNPEGKTAGWISRYAWGDDYHDIVKEKLDSLLYVIRDLCGSSVEGRSFVDSGPVLERGIAATTGIGWIGKNTHLISPRKGSWFFFGGTVSQHSARL